MRVAVHLELARASGLQCMMAAQITLPLDRSTAMVHFKYKTFSEEVCRPVAFIGGKDELRDAILMVFECTSIDSCEGGHHVGCTFNSLIKRIRIID